MSGQESTATLRYRIPPRPRCDVLLISEAPVWPLDQGFRIRGYNMARALADKGLNVTVSSIEGLPDDACTDLWSRFIPWPTADDRDLRGMANAWQGRGEKLRARIARFQGRNLQVFAGARKLVREEKPRIVIALGQHGPLLLQGLRNKSNIQRIWYAADEPASFQLSCMKRESPIHWPSRLRNAALYALIERAFAGAIDGVIGVNDDDTARLKRMTGSNAAITIRNGVDTDYFRESPNESANDRSLVFWGRMDFEPNIDAVRWFARHVWPQLSRIKGTRWKIVGKNPTAEVLALTELSGVQVTGEVDDLRPAVHDAAVTILPMHCGGGIKNKLLEAAAMAKPIAASPKAVAGLAIDVSAPPLRICATPGQWIDAIETLWRDPRQARHLGSRARQWVIEQHSWPRAAEQLIAWLDLPPAQPNADDERIAA